MTLITGAMIQVRHLSYFLSVVISILKSMYITYFSVDTQLAIQLCSCPVLLLTRIASFLSTFHFTVVLDQKVYVYFVKGVPAFPLLNTSTGLMNLSHA